ncbi:hypothetical protein K466DRAFT_606206 [Polyporus arcularius HHB13444]|uniref:Uncharacterized protein n=1 Tax=Polyporus arcularius HHB13444 TaxID=1314778 RepID=A0A5C3NPU8_9APHY|nr:hypothetical protein K466DRAFT_606206 [Polyporus arcularius HHB13444]
MSPPPTVPEHLPAIAHGGDSFEGFPGDFGSSELRAAELEPEEQPETRKAEYLPVSGFPSVASAPSTLGQEDDPGLHRAWRTRRRRAARREGAGSSGCAG